MTTILHFHIGRGGRFNNGGHLTYEGVVKSITDTHAYTLLFPPRVSEDQYDDSNDAEYTDASGNTVGLTNADIVTGIGRINIDNDYDTTYTTYATDLSDDELHLVFTEAQRFNGKYCHQQPLVDIFPEGTKFDLISKAAECGQLYEFYDHVLYGRDQDSFMFDE